MPDLCHFARPRQTHRFQSADELASPAGRGDAETSAPDRTAGLRGGSATPQLQKGGGGALRHPDSDQPSDPPTRAILRAIAVPPTSASGGIDRGRGAAVSRGSPRI